MKYLLTGGAGYIGLHVALAIKNSGHDVLLADNFSNSNIDNIKHIKNVLGICLHVEVGDIRSKDFTDKLFKKYQIDAVVHLAGLKSIPESNLKPLQYFDNNISGTINLLRSMKKYSIKKIVFSSSASVYGDPEYLPIDEFHPTRVKNPYARTKLQIEDILGDLTNYDPSWNIVCLRYFNPVGGHDSGLLGDSPRGIPSNLMPYIAAVAANELPILNIYGDDYDTADGTGIRDYIHVMDLADAHLCALEFLESSAQKNFNIFNIGTGYGCSVLEVVSTFEKSTGIKIPFQIMKRRAGDSASCYADVKNAKLFLKWEAKKNLKDMCLSAWAYKKNII
jgi:UDP-glucose 4-epimerase|tara:strand:- start:2354 stop:3358 length:1005 start_codon:yes stop_codon:yes gene_type:complete